MEVDSLNNIKIPPNTGAICLTKQLSLRKPGANQQKNKNWRAPKRMKRTDTSNPDYFHQVVDCQWGCPAHTDVPEYIRLIAQGRFTDAYMVNRESNVFPGILGRVCDRPCEPACRRGRIGQKPVAICRLSAWQLITVTMFLTGCPLFPRRRMARRLR